MKTKFSFSEGRCGGEDGAIIVEFALMAPFLVMMVLGVIEYGTLLRNDTTITGAVRNSARAGAQGQNLQYGDREALNTLSASLQSANNIVVNRVVIYRATSSTGTVPANCTSLPMSGSGAGSASDQCNVYNATQVSTASSGTWTTSTATCSTGSPAAGGGWDRWWCPNSRRSSLTGSMSPPDYLGVYIDVQYTPITGLLGSRSILDRAVNRIEPTV